MSSSPANRIAARLYARALLHIGVAALTASALFACSSDRKRGSAADSALRATQSAAPIQAPEVAVASVATATKPAEPVAKVPLAISVWDTPGSWVVLRDDAGAALALVSPPAVRGAGAVLVSIHGSASNPEWNCPRVRAAVGPGPWVVCPHPTRLLGSDTSWSSPLQIQRAIEGALAALSQRAFAGSAIVDVHLIGHSQGAVLLPSVVSAMTAGRFRSVTLFEGPPGSPAIAAALLAQAAPPRVLLVRGSDWGRGTTENLHALLRKRGVDAHFQAAGGGHFYGPEVTAALERERAWLMPASQAMPTGAAASGARPLLATLDASMSEALYDDGHRVALMDVPPGVRSPRPVVIAAHAAGVGPDWICAAARTLAGSYPIVVCPDAAPYARTLAEIRRAAWRFTEYLDLEHASYFGYSQGALQSAEPFANAATLAGFHFERVLIIEGPPAAKDYVQRLKAAGVSRALLVSGQLGWAPRHAELGAQLSASGIAATHTALAFGHVPTDAVIEQLATDNPWLSEYAHAAE